MGRKLGQPSATARIAGGGEAPCLYGTVKFYPTQSGVLVVADLYGLPRCNDTGIFGFHIHEGVACSGDGFANTNGHYNPTDAEHPKHAGDLPPLLSCKGRAYMAVLTDRFRLSEVIGRTIVIHSQPDDFHTQPAGNSGTKIACGRICRT